MTPNKNAFEWTIFAIGLVLITLTLGYLVYDGLTRGDSPASLSVSLGEVQLQRDRLMIPVLIDNNGDTTAEDVNVEVLLRESGGEEQRAEITFPYVPRHAHRRGWVSFQKTGSKRVELEGAVVGYREP